MRLVLEAGAVPEAARAAVEQLSDLPARASWREVVEPDLAFHRAIIDAADSERLQRAYAGLQSEIGLCMVQLEPAYDHPGAGRGRARGAAGGDRRRRPGAGRGPLAPAPRRRRREPAGRLPHRCRPVERAAPRAGDPQPGGARRAG